MCRDGRLKCNDQIIQINGHSLEGLPHAEAVKFLQSARGKVELVAVRDQQTPPTPSSPFKPHPPTIQGVSPQKPPNARRSELLSEGENPSDVSYRKIEKIELLNGGQGFGFGVVPAGDTGTVVHSIVPEGIADLVSWGRGGMLAVQL